MQQLCKESSSRFLALRAHKFTQGSKILSLESKIEKNPCWPILVHKIAGLLQVKSGVFVSQEVLHTTQWRDHISMLFIAQCFNSAR